MLVTIIGAGIGGLSAAIAIERVGHKVTVCERAPALHEVGAGIALWPNAFLALDRIGVGKQVRDVAGPAVDALLRRRDGRVLQRLPAGEIQARYGAPFVTLHRAELQAALAVAFGHERILLDHELMSHQSDVDGVHAIFTNGEVLESDMLIGADGLRSIVRSGMLKDGPPRYRGDTAWRAVVERPPDVSPDEPAFETISGGLRFGATPLSLGRMQWFAGDLRPAGEADGPDVIADLLAMFGDWHNPIPQLLAATTHSVIRTDVHDRPPPRQLVAGRAALIGDAAHPMGPDLGQGACLAIEDADTLATTLREARDVPAALARWEAERLRRVRKVARRVSMIGALARTRNPVVEAVRDWTTALAPQPIAWGQIDAVVGRSDPGTTRPLPTPA